MTCPRPVRLASRHGFNRTWASTAASADASLATRRQNPRCLNGGDQRRGPEDANPMPRPLHQLLPGKIRQQRLSSRFFFGRPELLRTAVWVMLSIKGSLARLHAVTYAPYTILPPPFLPLPCRLTAGSPQPPST